MGFNQYFSLSLSLLVSSEELFGKYTITEIEASNKYLNMISIVFLGRNQTAGLRIH